MSEREMNDLLEKLHRVESLMHRYQAFSMRAYGPQGTPHRGQGRVLALLKLQPEISQKDLAYLLGMRQQSVSELLAKLGQKGYITRTPSPDDRRTTIVKLTEEGKAAAEQTGQSGPGMEKIFASLSDEEQANLSDYLDRLAEALETALEGWQGPWKDFTAAAAGVGWEVQAQARHAARRFGGMYGEFAGRGRGYGHGHGHGPAPNDMPCAEGPMPEDGEAPTPQGEGGE